MQSVAINQLLQFREFDLLSDLAHDSLLKAFSCQEFLKGSVLIKKGSIQSELLHFLLVGRVELRHSFDDRAQLESSDLANCHALNVSVGKTTTVRALSDGVLISISRGELANILAQGNHYGIIQIDTAEEGITADELIDDNFEKDWQTCFIQSPLAMNLPHEAIMQLLSVMEDFEVKAGQEIVKAQTEGDYFYLIKSGEVIVSTEDGGPYQGASITLEPGQYFGDEALVAKTQRNATVTMASDGLLGRFSAEMFDELIKTHLLISKNENKPIQGPVTVLDVRFPIEIKQSKAGHSDTAVQNIPISLLRKGLSKMDQSVEYLIRPANDCRGALATYLMRQAGFNAFIDSEAS